MRGKVGVLPSHLPAFERAFTSKNLPQHMIRTPVNSHSDWPKVLSIRPPLRNSFFSRQFFFFFTKNWYAIFAVIHHHAIYLLFLYLYTYIYWLTSPFSICFIPINYLVLPISWSYIQQCSITNKQSSITFQQCFSIKQNLDWIKQNPYAFNKLFWNSTISWVQKITIFRHSTISKTNKQHS